MVPGNPFRAGPVLPTELRIFMKIIFRLPILLFMTTMLLTACEETFLEDVVPKTFLDIKLNPDEVFMYGPGPSYGVRLDPHLNDSIKVTSTIKFGTPKSGTISFIENEGWFYKPNAGFFGTDEFTYSVCTPANECVSSTVRMHVEDPIVLVNCTSQLTGESVETFMDQPIEIRIFANDMVCPFSGTSIRKPEKGTFAAYSYPGSFKNTVYVYFPPKGFVGTDSFKYRIFTNNGDLEATCTITVKP